MRDGSYLLRLVTSFYWFFPCSTVFYGQYKCFGPGASETGRAAWSHELTDEEAQPFVSLDYINGGLWVKEE